MPAIGRSPHAFGGNDSFLIYVLPCTSEGEHTYGNVKEVYIKYIIGSFYARYIDIKIMCGYSGIYAFRSRLRDEFFRKIFNIELEEFFTERKKEPYHIIDSNNYTGTKIEEYYHLTIILYVLNKSKKRYANYFEKWTLNVEKLWVGPDALILRSEISMHNYIIEEIRKISQDMHKIVDRYTTWEKEAFPFIGFLIKYMDVVDSILRVIIDKDYNRGLEASKNLLKKCQVKFSNFNEILDNEVGVNNPDNK